MTAESCLLDICWNVAVLFRPLNCYTHTPWITLHDDCAPVWHCCCTLVNTSVELYLHSTRQSIISRVCVKVLLSSSKFSVTVTVCLCVLMFVLFMGHIAVYVGQSVRMSVCVSL